ncbi:hypothetical protein TNCV_200721 [Trichonephila clavipes]|nr:hypothetical protein TNCV_200721 [Trichonephila clavipes]
MIRRPEAIVAPTRGTTFPLTGHPYLKKGPEGILIQGHLSQCHCPFLTTWIPSHIDLDGNEIADTLAKAGACEVPEPSAPLPFLKIFSRTKHHRIRPLGSPHTHSPIVGLVCSHPRIPRAHQAGFSRRFLAGVGYFESVRRHGPGLALLTNGSVQQQHEGGRGCCGNRGGCNCRRA